MWQKLIAPRTGNVVRPALDGIAIDWLTLPAFSPFRAGTPIRGHH
jgi:hypothetical protein